MSDDTRRLAYKDRFTNYITGNISGDVVRSFVDELPIDDSDVYIAFRTNRSEFTQVFSALLQGADLTHPESAIQVVWYFWEQFMTNNVFCTQVDACLPNTDNFKALLYQANPSLYPPESSDTWNVYYPNNGINEPIAENPSPTPDNECRDALWSGIREIIERLDKQGRDLLEELISFQDKVERMSRIVELIPILGSVLDTIGEYLADVVPDLLNAYNAYSDPATLDIIACDLFDLVCEECRYPTYDEIFSYLESNSYASFPTFQTASLRLLVQELGLSFLQPPAIVWYTVTAFQAYIYGLDAKFIGGYGKKTFQVWASLGEDLPTDNWQVLCSGCQPAPTNYDETISIGSDYSQYLSNVVGTLNPTNLTSVYSPGTPGINNYGVSVELNFSETLINDLLFQVSSYGTSGRQLYLWMYNQGSQVHYAQSGWVDNQQIWLSFSSIGVTCDRIVVTCAFNGDTDLNSRLWKARAVGVGVPPFQA